MEKFGTTYFHAVDANGVRMVNGAMTSVDPREDHHLMTSFLMFHQAVNRGIVFNGRKLGNLYLSSKPPTGLFEPTPEQLAELQKLMNQPNTGVSLGYRVDPELFSQRPATTPVYEISMLEQRPAEEPDANCVTAGDGTCVSTKACAHGPGVDPVQAHANILNLQDRLNFLAQAVLSGDGDHAMQIIRRIAHDDPRVAETLACLNDSAEPDADDKPLTCDACGTEVEDPFHYTGILNGVANRHIHLCIAHNNALPVIQVEGSTVLSMTTSFSDWEELEGCRKMKHELACLFDHDDEPRWKWILQTARHLKQAREQARDLLTSCLEHAQDGSCDSAFNEQLRDFRRAVHLWQQLNQVNLNTYRCWPDGTVHLVETSADGQSQEAPTYMSDDYTVIRAPHETAAIRLYAEWEAKAKQGANKC